MTPAAFVFAGNAIFTLTSGATGASLTFRLKAVDARPGAFFASLLTGPDNLSDYTYIGMVEAGRLRATRGTRNADAAPFKALDWFLRHLDDERVEFRRSGRCCRCARVLTTPQSIDDGIGPECAQKG